MKKRLITIILVIILSSIAYAQYSSLNPWHPLVQISGDNGVTSVDVDDDWIIDKAYNASACGLDGVCEALNITASESVEINGITIIQQHEFKQDKPLIVRGVYLEKNNKIKARITSQSGSNRVI